MICNKFCYTFTDKESLFEIICNKRCYMFTDKEPCLR